MLRRFEITSKKSSGRNVNGSLWVDLILLSFVLAVFAGIVQFGREWVTPSSPVTGTPLKLDLSLSALPVYAFMSFARGLLAYALSLMFSLIVGGIAAHSRLAERIIIPLLDILQSIPVLGFMPAFVISMVRIFPHNNVGLELACILMIFTAQTWNLAFAFYGSTKSVPIEYREVAKVHGYSWLRTFRSIELPVAAIPLIWNSMMSMAGGWFFLTINEAFRLGDRDYRVPGVGSYMSHAIEQGNTKAMIASIVAMFLIIIISDRLIWNPLTVWSLRFRMDETVKEVPSSPIIRFLRKSIALRKLRYILSTEPSTRKKPTSVVSRNHAELSGHHHSSVWEHAIKKGLKIAFASMFISVFMLLLWGVIQFFLLASKVSVSDLREISYSLFLTFLRVTACLALSALWAAPVGIMIGRNPKLSPKVQPIVQLIASFPAPMLYPVVIVILLALGINFEWGCTVLMILGAQWYVLFNTIAGAQAIPNDLYEVAEIYRMSRLRLWKTLYLPAIFPSLLTGLVTAAGGAWNASIVSEIAHFRGETLIATGIGSLITRATETGNMPLLCASVGLMATTIVCLNRLVWKPLFSIADNRYSLNR